MILDFRSLALLVVVVAVSGWVARGLMASWFKLRREDSSTSSVSNIEERLKKIEEATSGLIMDVAAIREKERFMARLQASATVHSTKETREGDSPFVTQSIPVIPRAKV